MEIILKLCSIAILPIIASVILYLVDSKTKFGKAKNSSKQIIFGLIFGILAICGTEFGVDIGGAIINVRAASVLTAGLMFGAPAGIIAGIIGGVERYLAVYWGAGMYTRLACTISTILAGFIGAFLRKHIFDDEKPTAFFALVIGILTEVLHMMMVFFTNMGDIAKAFSFVKQCTLPMVLINGISVMLIVFIINHIDKSKADRKAKQISIVFQRWLLIFFSIAFILTGLFVSSLQHGISKNIEDNLNKISSEEVITNSNIITGAVEEVTNARDVSIYVTMFIETSIFGILFILIYALVKKLVVNDINKTNDSLEKITSGNLDVVVDVNTTKELSELSDHINMTVATLKAYIEQEATRIDKELEFARGVQESALPNIFPPYPERSDLDIYAIMNPAKEVGGDFYDFYFINEDKLALVMADVSDKGIPAAMFMMTTKALIKGYLESGKSIEEALTLANDKLCENNEKSMFVTAWVGVLDLKTGVLEFVNAGHNFPLLKHKNGEFEFIKSSPNLVLAGMNGVKYIKSTLTMSKEDIIYLYTDGVTEATNTKNELYGNDKLRDILNLTLCFDAREICECVKEDVDEFANGAPQFDDITMLCLKYFGNETLTKKVDISLKNLSELTKFVEDEMIKNNASKETIIKMNVALDEIYSNIVKFSGATYCKVSCYVDQGIAYMRFEDDGAMYNPEESEDVDITLSAEERPIGSLGLYMVKQSMDGVKYEYRDFKNVFTIAKKI